MNSTGPQTEVAEAGGRRLIAPWWHTALMAAIIIGLSFTGARHLQRVGSGALNMTPQYLATIAYEWALAGLAWWGIRMRGVPRAELVGERRPGLQGWLSDAGAALIFWVIALLVLALLGQALAHGFKLDPQKISDVTEKLAPTTGMQMVLFLILCISAGICEEFVFRGYLQQQFTRIGKGVSVGIVVSALLFGCAHGYEGFAGMLLITAYGAMFSVLALRRRGLRTGMIAHAWHDCVSGAALVLLRHHALYLGAK